MRGRRIFLSVEGQGDGWPAGSSWVVAVSEHMEEVQALCREYGALRLEVFGSALTAQFDPETSDIDNLEEYPPDYDFGPWLGRYLNVMNECPTCWDAWLAW